MDETGRKYAGFWIRLLAYIMDFMILGLSGRILFGPEVTDVNVMGHGLLAYITYTGLKSLIPVIYVLGSWIWLSATPGKLILGLRIINRDGNKLTWKDAIIRFLGYIPSTFIFCAGFISIAFDERKQGWHDKIAKTFVVRKETVKDQSQNEHAQNI